MTKRTVLKINFSVLRIWDNVIGYDREYPWKGNENCVKENREEEEDEEGPEMNKP